ncbi:MAG: carotenoid oxygenase family protein [Burkholderiales bacterium]|nr:carotenoid oxygenase family protein [Burkholderiales bacterium]
MTAHTSTEAQAVATAGRLRGFATGAREFDDTPVEVKGELPAWLRGNLLLNGPALWELPQGSYGHWFDGLAMLHRIRLGQGEATYRSRFMLSDDYRRSTAMGRPAMSGFGTDDLPGLWRRLRGIFSPQVTDNASVVMSQVGGGWAAATESPRMVAFDPDSLQTRGPVCFDDKLVLHLMSAHGINDAAGDYWNVGIEFGPQCTYKLFRVKKGSLTREVVGSFKCKEPGYLHGFAMTPKHAVIWETAWRAQPLAFMFSGKSYMDHFRWKPEGGSRIHTVSLADGKVQSWDVPAMVCFHAVQAYEDAQGVVAELAVYADASVMRELMLEVRRQGTPLKCVPRLARYRLHAGQSRAEPEFFGPLCELAQVHPSRWTRSRATLAWGASAAGDFTSAFLDRTVRIELDTGHWTTWQRGGAIQLEPLFVAPEGATGEEEGVLLVPTLADGDTGTVIGVVDPARMTAMAELHLPQVVPFGFHAAFKGA